MKRREIVFVAAAFAAGIVCAVVTPLLVGAMGRWLLGPATIWREEVRSSDGLWTAIGLTEQQGGGTDDCVTTVSVKRTNVSEDPTEVLGFDCGPVGKAYTLDNTANVGGTIGLSMKWIGSSRLEVTHDWHLAGEPYFQVVTTSGIDIVLK